MTMKIQACKLYTNLMIFGLLQEEQASKDVAVIIMPLLNRMLSNTNKNIQLEGCKMLSQIVSIGEIYQRQAFDCNLVHTLIEWGRCISVTDVEAASTLLQAIAVNRKIDNIHESISYNELYTTRLYVLKWKTVVALLSSRGCSPW